MSTPPAEHVDALESLIGDTEHLVPEVGADLARLVQGLRTVIALDLQGDRRLLGIDAANTINTLTNLIAMRRAGVDTPALTEAARDGDLLVRDMCARADRLVADKAQSIAIHAAVSKHRTEDSPQDLTRELRLIAAAPAPKASDTPGLLVAIEDIHSPQTPGAYGRVSGSILTYPVAKDLPAAPRGAAILPLGSVVRFQPGESFLIHAQGTGFLDRFTPPTAGTTVTTTLVEAQDEVIVHGPAVLSCAPHEDTAILSQAEEAGAFLTAINKAGIDQSWINSIGSPLGFWMGTTMIATGSSFIASNAEINAAISSGQPSLIPLVTFVFPAIVSVITALVSFPMSYNRHRAWMDSKSKVADLMQRMPPSIINRTISKRVESFAQRYPGALPPGTPQQNLPNTGEQGCTLPTNLPTMRKRMYTKITGGDGFNLHPPRQIQAMNAKDVAVMEPLLSLPAPSLDNGVVVPLRPAFQKA